jgi:hypothetical protein
MIEIARRRHCGGRVEWRVGDARHIGEPNADLAIMTGHVAQFFLTEESWRTALVALQRSLRVGGYLSFESRNPDAREWESWTSDVKKSVNDPRAGRIHTWSEVNDVTGELVSYTIHYRFVDTGEELRAAGKLRFRSKGELTRTLADAGFTVDVVYADWDRRPADPTAKELIVVATRR